MPIPVITRYQRRRQNAKDGTGYDVFAYDRRYYDEADRPKRAARQGRPEVLERRKQSQRLRYATDREFRDRACQRTALQR